jgi:hypothetical protein
MSAMNHHKHEHSHTHAHSHSHSHAHDHLHEHEHTHPHEHAGEQLQEHTHSHNHADEHSHDHTHEKDHQYSHSPAPGSAMSLQEKAVKLLDHWIRHNNDHAETYREWADRLAGEGMAEAAALLVEAADMCVQINDLFSGTAEQIRKAS